ncbi:hypothetical protein SETIT_7G027500v2 [Setaria italica]|uniref:Uncharacterized protein n=1 Tax=Setaria italica TaxID=4555 RepID=A0A368RR65_SETIT|nr:hypothetical protein SETIT_7G027500v2 [Setaria italica]
MAPWAQCCTGMGTWHHGRSAAPSTPRSPARRPQVPHPAAVDHPAWPRLSRTHPAAHKYAPRRCVPSRDRETQRCAPSREEAAAPRCPGTPPVGEKTSYIVCPSAPFTRPLAHASSAQTGPPSDERPSKPTARAVRCPSSRPALHAPPSDVPLARLLLLPRPASQPPIAVRIAAAASSSHRLA